MAMVAAKALLFDMDGVLVNSIPAVERVWTKWAREHGFAVEEVLGKIHGRPSIATVRDYLPDADHMAENKIIEQCEIDDLEGVVPLPGAQALLTALPRNAWTIVTSCTRRLAEVRLRAAGLPAPEVFVTSSEITHGKPHPEPYLKGASVLGVPAAECLVVEDALAGVRSGKAAGARVIALRTTTSEASLREAGADWLVDDCAALQLLPATDGALTLELHEVSEAQRSRAIASAS